MIVKLLTEHHLEFLSLTGGCRGSFKSTLEQNVKLLEISCRGSYMIWETSDCKMQDQLMLSLALARIITIRRFQA